MSGLARGRTLRARLVLATIALLAAVSLVIGLVSVLAMRAFLQDRLDSQLTSAVHRSRTAAARPPTRADGISRPQFLPGRGQPAPEFLGAPGQGTGTLGVIVTSDGTERSAVLDSTGTARGLTGAQRALVRAVPADRQPHTVELGGTLGDYRILAQRTGDGTLLMTGLPLSGVQDLVMRLALIITVVGLVGLVAAGVIGATIVRFTLRPLRRVAATATSVAEMPLDKGDVALAVRVPASDTDVRTEVGQVGSALNRLLEHVAGALAVRHASEERVRRFVADASHELRTPLAAIRGYAELTRRSRQPIPPDVAHALGRVESESVRMTGLVDDLLLLARLDDGRPLEQAPVELSRLVVDAAGDAHVAGPDHRWRLDLPDQPVTVRGDAARLHQAVANLLANVRVHTPARTTVTVGLDEPAGDPRGVTVRVVDDGPGIPGRLLPEVFERFARGDSSRSRSTGSTGLGLSIVTAVAAAHGGTITVTSRPGRTEFRLWLPALAEPAEAPDQPVTAIASNATSSRAGA